MPTSIGAVTTYTYTYYNPTTNTGANTQTATVDGRWQTTTLDGFGRTVQVQKGNGSTIVCTVQTQYAPCACSPLGKMSAVSQPYGPGATVYWTTYTYDGSGRTLTVTAPDGASCVRYSGMAHFALLIWPPLVVEAPLAHPAGGPTPRPQHTIPTPGLSQPTTPDGGLTSIYPHVAFTPNRLAPYAHPAPGAQPRKKLR